jgi:hypothetical protein
MSGFDERFQVYGEIVGSYEFYPTFGYAERIAAGLANSAKEYDDDTYFIYDRMAHRGCFHLWRVKQGEKHAKPIERRPYK